MKSSVMGWVIVAVLFLPAAFHLFALALDIRSGQSILLGRLDLVVLAALVIYLFVGTMVARRPAWIARFLALTYAIAVPVVFVEIALSKRADNLPMNPIRMVTTARGRLPGVTGTIRFTVNSRGVRAPDTWPSARADRYLCVGGSTTQCFLISDEDTWPWLLGQSLSSALRRDILVSNAGVTGAFSLNHLYLLTHYRGAMDYGTVILLCGINDAGTLLRRNYAVRAAAVPMATFSRPAGEGPYYRRLAVVNALYHLKSRLGGTRHVVQQDPEGRSVERTRQTRQERLATNPIRTVPEGLPEALDTYRDTLRRIVQLCRSRGQQVLVLTQPVLYGANMPAELSGLLTEYVDNGAYTPEVLETVMLQYNATTKDVCAQMGVECLDLASLLPRDMTVFYDDCHFNISGCRKVAAILSDHLLQGHPTPSEGDPGSTPPDSTSAAGR